MSKRSGLYNTTRFLSAIIMIAALVWLTISTPFVFRAQQDLKKFQKEMTAGSEDDSSPFAGSEEKTPAGINLSEEYLHHTADQEHPWFTLVRHHGYFASSLYIAFHGELFCPPPNA